MTDQTPTAPAPLVSSPSAPATCADCGNELRANVCTNATCWNPGEESPSAPPTPSEGATTTRCHQPVQWLGETMRCMEKVPCPRHPSAPASAPSGEGTTEWVCTKCRRVGVAADAEDAQRQHDAMTPPCGYCVLSHPTASVPDGMGKCGAWNHGFVCTLPDGHSGRHETWVPAHMTRAWPNAESPAATASAPSEGVEGLDAALEILASTVRTLENETAADPDDAEGAVCLAALRIVLAHLATLTSRVREVEEERDRAIALLNERLPACERRASDLESRAARLEEERDRNRPFPVQLGNRGGRGSIPWWLAEEAYTVYSKRYGSSQSLERLGERGGFGDEELDMLIPGWRDRLDRVKQLEADLARLSEALAEAKRSTLCGVCSGQPLASGRPCICGGIGTEQAEMQGLREECFRLTEARAAGERDRHALTKALEFAWGWGGHDKECPIGINVNAPDTTLCTCGYDERADELMDLEEACGLDFWTNSRAALSARRPTETGGET